MCWIIWAATHDALTKDGIKAYDIEMHALLPKISGEVVSVAALDNDVYAVAKQMWNTLYSLDAEIGDACLTFENAPEPANAKFINVAPQVYDFEDAVLVKLAEVARAKTDLILDLSIFSKPRSASR